MELKKNLRYEETEKLIEYANQTDNDVMKELARRLEDSTMPRTNADHKRAKFMAETLSEYVNSYNFDKVGFTEALQGEHRTIQQSAISLMLFTIREFANIDPHRVDPRNRKGVEVCRKIADFMEANNLPVNLPLI